jgi:nondiscriminating aspartyl-tRNA synthetase
MRYLASDLPAHIGKRICLRGWLNNTRAFGKLTFLILRDRSGLSQTVIETKEEAEKLQGLHPGSILRIEGRVQETKGKLELVEPHILVEHPIREVPPVEYYKPEMAAELDFLLDHRPISLRHRSIQAVFKIQAEIAHAYRLYMHDQIGATEYFAPNLIGASSEGGAEFFNVDYFGHPATLAQSSQLYKQIMVGVNERVFALMPFFRAEPSHTTRHLSEGKQLEFEIGFFEDWREILDIQEGCVKAIIAHLHAKCEQEIDLLGGQIVAAPQEVPIPRLTFAEAQELFFKKTGIDERNEPDLSPAAERALCAWAKETSGTDFLFVTDWLTSKRPFYAAPNAKKPHLTNTFDLLCAGTEITSGGERRHSYESMLEGLALKEMDPDNFSDYLSIFRYGMPPHGGFGMGLERLTMTLLKLKNIREASLFPSDTKRIAGNRIRAHLFFGGENIRNEIIRRLKEANVPFMHLTHEETPTAQDSAKARGGSLEDGVKSLIIKGKTSKKNYQFNLPAHRKLNMKAASLAVGEKCEFEDPAVILERFGLRVGGVPPFGNLLHLDNYFDLEVEGRGQVFFNCGLLTESIRVASSDLIRLADGKLGRYAESTIA